ncbi:hypothetical protein AB0K09_30165, partial [Streptomyces sp. NPDC049577]|uniref:hypothetical protein n=1 Tax=Streptomyces sp. NPDC049577 TaxID=3155153 RepID=UPI0034434E6B
MHTPSAIPVFVRPAAPACGQRFPVASGNLAAWRSDSSNAPLPLPAGSGLPGRGALGYGVHLVVTASRNMEVRPALKDQLLNRLEL